MSTRNLVLALPLAALTISTGAGAAGTTAVADTTTVTTTATGGHTFPQDNGLRLRAARTGEVHLILDGRKHLIPNPETHRNLFGDDQTVRLVITLDNIAGNGPLSDGAHLARTTDDDTVYLISNGLKREILPAALDEFRFDRQRIRTTAPEVLRDLPAAAPLTA
ncbi:hypothetical protein SAMN05216188_11372 [Lentzea xinjiangensis]|uniref:Uncharacterized protein n=1 Tax=Lentzea xinjiangensis TaxID=402600 RepID=A0A1H9QJ98_9PSEU|nr:hypothetical protein [Lentzea xinjiangensis]SER60576.1 hypothetical protein SAMN05216188_11372 [Lentzea xinjiangensis]